MAIEKPTEDDLGRAFIKLDSALTRSEMPGPERDAVAAALEIISITIFNIHSIAKSLADLAESAQMIEARGRG
jgi:hypothetical protein